VSKLDPSDVAIGRALRKARRAKDMTQTQLGEELAVTYQQVQKYEKGENRISLVTWIKAAQVLGLPEGKPVRAWITAAQK
jgi:transcriptional regulator with XRE-family HTH domain